MTGIQLVARRFASKQTCGVRPRQSTTARMRLWLVGVIWLTGCAPILPVSGLRPEYPEARAGFVKVNSLQPTLRWEAFPPPEVRETDPEGALGRIRAVTYDLLIWRAEEKYPEGFSGEYPGEPIYSRRALPVPWHTLEERLEPSTKYFWTVRARFELDGLPRLTQWGETAPNEIREVVAREIVPSPLHYRFKTP